MIKWALLFFTSLAILLLLLLIFSSCSELDAKPLFKNFMEQV